VSTTKILDHPIVTIADTMCIDITLLAILHFLGVLSYSLHLIFQLLDRFSSHQDPILKSIPTQRNLTWSPIKDIKRRHLNRALVNVFIREFYMWKKFFSMLLLVHHIHAQHVFQGLLYSFGLPICLRVICSTKFKSGSQGLWKLV
jgi:hypothetical protein